VRVKGITDQQFMSQPIKVTAHIRLRDFDPDYHEGLDKDKTRDKTQKLCDRIGELQQLLYAESKHALLIVLQGMDTSGKDGTVKHVLDAVNPAGVETANFKGPSTEELAHDFLWRIHKAVPRYGNFGVFNRSHYEDVLIVRVMNLQPPRVWRKRYEQINAFEANLTANNLVLLKFFLHISKEEQAERLRARLKDHRKNWKFDPEDLKMRAHWEKFMRAYEDALNRCSPPEAPWHIIPANRKWYRDYVVAKTIVKALEDLNLDWPKAMPGLEKIRVV
jgi:PPK2 family polyphosphate:nucleotide phosphotransferase